MAGTSRFRSAFEAIFLRTAALVVAFGLFSVFILLNKVNPLEALADMYKGAFGSKFSIFNSLQRSSPLILTALCTAIPARLGLVIIGNEGALVVGSVCAAIAGLKIQPAMPNTVFITIAIASAISAGLSIQHQGAQLIRHMLTQTLTALL